MQGKKSYQEKLFTTFQLSERIPESNFYRRLKETLNLHWLYRATSKYYGKEGQQSIDPVVFFKLILVGYLENLSSDRRIINTVSMRMDMLFFIGYDIDEELPWHSTLSRTRQLYNQEVFKELFRKVLKQCIDEGMVAGRRQAIDSVFVKANASMESLVEKEVLADALVYADGLYEQSKEETSYKSNDRYYSPTDPDAKIATKRGKPSQLNYLAQVSVDTSSHVITNIDAYCADKQDNEYFAEVVEQTKNNLQTNGLVIEEVLADAGYSSGTTLKYLEENNIVGYIPNINYKAERPGFTYDSHSDEFTCSQGARITFRRMMKGRAGQMRKVYSSSGKDCAACPLRSQCIGNVYRKSITVSENNLLLEQMHNRVQTAKGKRMRKLRSATVEPVLGTLVNFLGMKRVNTKGVEQAGKCVIMAALAYNLKKLLRFYAPKSETAIKMIKMRRNNLRNLLFTLCSHPNDIILLPLN